MAKLVSGTYGEALFQTALESGKGDVLLEETEGIRKALAENPDFDRLMLHPGISREKKLEMAAEVFQGRVSGEMYAFLVQVISKGRYGELQAIFQYFVDKMKEERRIGVAHVTSAAELTEEQKEQVVERLLATTGYLTMEMHYAVEPELIGGMVIRIKDRVVDSSIRTKLDDLTKQLLQVQLS